MKLPAAIRYSIIFLFLSSFTYQNPNAKTLILGKWEFEKMEFVGDYAVVPKAEQDKVHNMNKGTIITFNKDGKFSVKKKTNGKDEDLGDGEYKISADGKKLTMPFDQAGPRSATILLITNERVRLSMPESPVMVWKRSK